MYYGSGNYEAFARPEKPARAERTSAYLVGSGIAALAAACFLVRDGQVAGERIHILEKNPIPGGALDGLKFDSVGYVIRGDRKIDDHYECLWDLMRSIPAASDPDISVLDEFYRINRRDPNYSLSRVTERCGQAVRTEGRYNLSDKGASEIIALFFASEASLVGKRISDVLDAEVLSSDFWLFIRTLYGFENWHSALELHRYLKRYVHDISGIPDLKSLRFTASNQYESLVLPMVSYLQKHGVQFEYGVQVTNIAFDTALERKVATRIDLIRDGKETWIDLTPEDLVLTTLGGCTENSSMGSQTTAAPTIREIGEGSGWSLWKHIAEQDASFGRPEAFSSNPEETGYVTATITTLDLAIVPYIKKICKRDPFSGRTVTGGIVTAKDSSWLLSWSVGRQPQFKEQSKEELVIWLYGLFPDKQGNYITKAMRDATGEEICAEWLYHLGVPVEEIGDLASNHANTVPVLMPFASAAFMPRKVTDRPKVVPDKAVNFAFLGQFAETAEDASFTVEYSVRTAMEAVYTLLDVERAIPAVWGSTYDVREILDAAVRLRDGKTVTTMDLSFTERRTLAKVLKMLSGTDAEELLRTLHVVD